MPQQTYTREQVSQINPKERTVFIIDNVVYDATAFLDEHPGGHEVLVNVASKDATEEFEDVGHSVDAKELMKKYVIGEVAPADRVESRKRQVSWDDNKSDTADSGFLSSWKFPLLLGVLVTVLYSYLFG